MLPKASEVAEFITHLNIPGWTNVTAADISIEPLGNGFNSLRFKVARTNLSSTSCAKEEPSCLVYKKYATDKLSILFDSDLRINSPLVQSLISYEMSRRGWGPKVYGLKDNIQIEEYIEFRTLTATEASTEEMSNDLARVFARFHSIDLPIDKQRGHVLSWMANWLNIEKSALAEWIDSTVTYKKILRAWFSALFEFPFEAEIKWLSSMMAQIKHRTVFAVMDPNYMKCLVKNKEQLSPHQDRCMINDFHASTYYHRGYDLGGHFVMLYINRLGKNAPSSYPSRVEQEYFLSRYLEQCSRLFHDFDPSSIDNIYNLHMEVDVHAMHYSLCCIAASVSLYKMYHLDSINVNRVIRSLIDLFFTLKNTFRLTYPFLEEC